MEYDVFISYSREDLSVVEPLVKDIEQKAGVKCWIDWNGIETGTQFEEVIIKAIDSVDIVIFFISENSISSQYARMEVNYAYNTKKKVVPIVLDGGDLRGWFLFKFGSIDYIDINQKRQYDKLIQNLQSWCGTSEYLYTQKLAKQSELIEDESSRTTIENNKTNVPSNAQGGLQTIFHFQERHWLINLVCIFSLFLGGFIIFFIPPAVLYVWFGDNPYSKMQYITTDIFCQMSAYVLFPFMGIIAYFILLNRKDAINWMVGMCLYSVIPSLLISYRMNHSTMWLNLEPLIIAISYLIFITTILCFKKNGRSAWSLLKKKEFCLKQEKFQIGMIILIIVVFNIMGFYLENIPILDLSNN